MISLDPMLRPRSVAIVGATERRGSVGDQTMRQLISGGFTGRVIPVNPRYETVHGLRSHRSLEDVSEPVDLAVLAVANGNLESEMEKVVAVGARSVAIFASCHGVTESGVTLRDRLANLANAAGIPICGGNGMGFLNLEDRTRICGFYQPAGLEPGAVSFLSHSGSLFSAMLHNRRDIRFNLVVSTGLEINTAMDAYMDWVLNLESTRVLALFLETIRRPTEFRRALVAAEQRDLPVIVLKVGASDRGRQAVTTHSEALAGDDAVYEALFDAHGVHRVWSMDEMADTLELFASGRRATAVGIGAVYDFGGERALLIDTADRLGVDLPHVAEPTSSRLSAVLDPGLQPDNPVDAWGTGRDARSVFAESLLALADDPLIGAIAFCVDLTSEEVPDDAYSHAAFAAAGGTEKPVAVIANMTTTIDPSQAARLRAGGVVVLEGTETGLRAMGHLIDHHRRGSWPPLDTRLSAPVPGLIEGRNGEVSALGVLAGYGIPIPSMETVHDEKALLAAAGVIGYPVVLKTAASLDHKTEVGGVKHDIEDEAGLVAAYHDLAARLGPRAMVAEKVSAGVEIGLGMITDEQFGPVILVSAGGTLIEVMAERVALLPRVDRAMARRALARLRVGALLGGSRGAPPANIDALADVIARFSELAADAAGILASIDVNPVIAGPERSVAVDALMKAR